MSYNNNKKKQNLEVLEFVVRQKCVVGKNKKCLKTNMVPKK